MSAWVSSYQTGWSILTGLPHPWVIYHRVWVVLYSNSVCRNTAPDMYIPCSNDFHYWFALVQTWSECTVLCMWISHSSRIFVESVLEGLTSNIINNNEEEDMTRNVPYCCLSRLYCTIGITSRIIQLSPSPTEWNLKFWYLSDEWLILRVYHRIYRGRPVCTG